MLDADNKDFGFVKQQLDQLSLNFRVAKLPAISRVIVFGLGGASGGASLLSDYKALPIPWQLTTSERILVGANQQTLVVFVSYSGQNPEVLAAAKVAKETGATVLVLTSGGALSSLAAQAGWQQLDLPPSLPSRLAALAVFKALLEIAEALGILSQTTQKDLDAALSLDLTPLLPQTPTKHNLAKQLAYEVLGQSIVIYAHSDLQSITARWQLSLQQNAKQLSWTSHYPAFGYSEVAAWRGQPLDKNYTLINLLIKDSQERDFLLAEKLLSGYKPVAHLVKPQATNRLAKLIWLFLFGDCLSLYVASLNNQNPWSTTLISKYQALRSESVQGSLTSSLEGGAQTKNKTNQTGTQQSSPDSLKGK